MEQASIKTPYEFEVVLKKTLADFRLSKNERQVLSFRLSRDNINEPMLSQFRAIGFKVARDALNNADSQEILIWLEEVNNLLLPTASPATEESICEAYFSPHDDCAGNIIELLGTADKRLDLCIFTITDNRIRDALLDALRRRVAVRIISDCEKCEDLGADIDNLRDHGIPVRLNRPGGHMHHKFAIVDSHKVLTGSYNWTRAAAEHNYENIVVSNNRNLVERFVGEFESIWKESRPL